MFSIGSIQDTFAQFVVPEIGDQAYVTEKMQNIQQNNQTIKDFKIVKMSPDGYRIFASLDQSEVGTLDTKNVFLYRLATADPAHSFTQEYTADTRFYQTVRALTDSVCVSVCVCVCIELFTPLKVFQRPIRP